METSTNLDPEYLRRHSLFDHHLFGWAGVLIALLLITHTISDALDPLWRYWPVPFLLVSSYFSLHIEPDVKQQFPTWWSSWKSPVTQTHRIISMGGVIGSVVELGIMNARWSHILLLLVLPFGLIIAAVLFFKHHHPGEAPDIRRQHDIMATTQLLAGTSLGAARIFGLEAFADAWPWLMAVIGYLFVTYSESGPLPTVDQGGHGGAH